MILMLDVTLCVITPNHIGNVQGDPFLFRPLVMGFVPMKESSGQRLVMMDHRMD